MYLGVSLKTPKISQNLPISYYIELDLGQFNQVSGLWLENDSNRGKLLDSWNQYLETIGFEPPKGLFTGKVSLIGISTFFNKIEGEQALNQKGTGQAFDRPQNNKENEILVKADISSSQIAINYLKKIGSTQFDKESGITAITLKQPFFGKNKYYYSIKDNQITVSSSADLLNSPDNKIKFPRKNILSALSDGNKLLKIFIKPSNISFLDLIMADETEPSWIFAEISPQKLIINFENQDADPKTINSSWLKLIPTTPNIAFFNKNISKILKKYLSSIILQQELQTLAEDNQSLLILSPKNANFSINQSDYDYVLVVSNSKNLNSNSPEIKEIEQKNKKIFAKGFPAEKVAYLPDNSTITELISQPEIFEFQEKILLASPTGGPKSSREMPNISAGLDNFQSENWQIKYLQKPNLEFAYAFFEDKIIFSNSIAALEQVIASKTNQNFKDSLVDCLNTQNISTDFIFFNPDPLFQQNYGIKKAIITDKKACVY